MPEITSQLKNLNDLIEQFAFAEALEKFYHDEIMTFENEGQPTVGIEAYKVSMIKFVESVSHYSAKLKSVMVCNDISATEWHYKFTHAQWGEWDKDQISIQRWKDGRIIHERHYY
jgi:hypothetical protein